jgi:hypothetical protein
MNIEDSPPKSDCCDAPIRIRFDFEQTTELSVLKRHVFKAIWPSGVYCTQCDEETAPTHQNYTMELV